MSGLALSRVTSVLKGRRLSRRLTGRTRMVGLCMRAGVCSDRDNFFCSVHLGSHAPIGIVKTRK